MVLLPLGLGEKRPRFPFITVAIALICIVVSIAYFPTVRRMDAFYTKTFQTPEYMAAAQTFGSEYSLAFPDRSDPALLSGVIAILLNPELKVSAQNKALLSLVKPKDKQKPSKEEAELQSATIRLAGSIVNSPSKIKDAKEFESYQSLSAVRAELELKIQAEQKKAHMLTRANRSFAAMALAQWTHGGWMHLIGNLLCLCAFGAAVEYRLRREVYIGMYLLGGTVGYVAQLLSMTSSITFTLGASANISALTGAFLVLFYDRPMKFLWTFGLYNKVISVPTKIIVPLMFLLGDVAGTLAAGGGVAHMAHLGGFIVGALVGGICLTADRLGSTYLSEEERTLQLALSREPSFNRKISMAESVLKLNSRNIPAVDEILRAASLDPSVLREPGASVSLQTFFQGPVTGFLDRSVQKKNVRLIETHLRNLSLDFSFPTLLVNCDVANLEALANRQLKKGDWFLAFRLYDVVTARTLGTPHAAAAETTMRNALTHLVGQNADLTRLNEYEYKQRETAFAKLLNEFNSPTVTNIGDARVSSAS